MKKGHFTTPLRGEFSSYHPCTRSINPVESRQQFVADLKKAIGDIEDNSLPLQIKSSLQQLLTASDVYLLDGNELVFMPYCEHAIEMCGQGWNHLSHWASTEQTLCYTLYWSLKAAIERHNS